MVWHVSADAALSLLMSAAFSADAALSLRMTGTLSADALILGGGPPGHRPCRHPAGAGRYRRRSRLANRLDGLRLAVTRLIGRRDTMTAFHQDLALCSGDDRTLRFAIADDPASPST